MTRCPSALTGSLTILLAALLFSGAVHARPEFARLTGQSCGHCHVSPMGGDALTEEGTAFQENLRAMDLPRDASLRLSRGQKLLNVFLWLIHIPLGVAWISLFLVNFLPALKTRRPAVPRKAPLRNMLGSMVVALITGTAIVYFRMLGMPGLFTTRFGMLLILKLAAVLILLIATVYLFWLATIFVSRRYRLLSKHLSADGELALSEGDLRIFDGSEKRRALVSVEGRLYDVTGRDLWTRGIHPGGHRAGFDLSGAFSQAPHGKEVLERVPMAGRYAAEKQERVAGPRWAALAGVMSSAMILLVVVLWRM